MATIVVEFNTFRSIFKQEIKNFWYIIKPDIFEIYSVMGNNIIKTIKAREGEEQDMLFINDFLKDSFQIHSIQLEETNDVDKNAITNIYNMLENILEGLALLRKEVKED